MATAAERQMQELDAEIEAMEAPPSQRQPERTPEGQEGREGTPESNESSAQGEGKKAPSVDDYFGIAEEYQEAEPPQQEEVQQQEPPSEPEPSLAEEYDRLEHRYKTLRRTSDAFKFESRQQIAVLQEEVASLQETNDRLKDELFKLQQKSAEESLPSFFTDEDRETFGPTIDNFQRTLRESVNAAVKPLQDEISQLKKEKREQLKRLAATNKQESYKTFEESLSDFVPDYQKWNKDPGFISWLKQPGEFGGFPRLHYLRNAEKSGDVERVAQYFITYKDEVNRPNNLLAENASPVGDRGDSGNEREVHQNPQNVPNHLKPPEKRLYTQAQLDRFYEDDINGKFIGKEALRDELENQFELALREGRVVRRIPT